ncbi:hypothetical protein CWI75_00895 [Kineobactrum sediminis]|uniref:diguanylate cyclase n=1 Tax=Kineobactrum sediminis TaxID=1905677 RepID=A0A2N5Y6D6_9GAMM|nr:GGDEF domain-containing protein [Kineobactrum sediminis]PLW83946.1 hypothetical protein CWI75_00895 [Kineobactrum sediminis]
MRIPTALAANEEPKVGSILANLVKLSSTGDIKLLDRIFLESICELLEPRSALLCVLSGRGRMMQARMRRNTVTGIYETEDQPIILPEQQQALLATVIASADQMEVVNETGDILAAYPLQSNQDSPIYLLLEIHSAIDGDQLVAFNAIKRIYHNFRDFMDESQRDPLTGLLNRRYFDSCIHRALEISDDEKPTVETGSHRRMTDRTPPRYWLAILDIDHFKRFNDTYGHLYGDEILLLFSRIMEDTFRDSDLLFRFGGEEFVVITENTDAGEAKLALERFRTNVQKYPFPQGERVTVSCGAIEAVGSLSATSLLGRADEALYYAKNHGRNQTAFYEELVTAGKVAVARPTIGAVELF